MKDYSIRESKNLSVVVIPFPTFRLTEVAVWGLRSFRALDIIQICRQGIPDVAAQGDNFLFWFQGQAFLIGGTSAASPTFAGIVALLNDARIAAGKPPLGFLNPLIYRNTKAFNDITVGNNPGCGTSGFQCRVGWDPGKCVSLSLIHCQMWFFGSYRCGNPQLWFIEGYRALTNK